MFQQRAHRRIDIRSRVASFATLSMLVISFVLSSSCARRSSDSLVSTCVLPDDQLGTLTGRWKAPPVPIAFHQGDFSAEEMTEIALAANTWNTFYTKTLNLAPIDFGTAESPRQVTTAKPNASYVCSQTIVTESTGAFTGQVVLYKDGVWPYPSQPNAMALTTFCKGSGSPLPNFNMAIIEFNYQNFFVSGKRIPDLQTIILHEFGHLLGLNHSCEATSATGVPGCTDTGVNGAYLLAVMNPTFNFSSAGYGETKRSLNANDQGRANCLYSY